MKKIKKIKKLELTGSYRGVAFVDSNGFNEAMLKKTNEMIDLLNKLYENKELIDTE